MRKLMVGLLLALFVALSIQSTARSPFLFEALEPVNTGAKCMVGMASWYGEDFEGIETASGELFDMNGLTGAHRGLALGTRIRVTNLKNRKSLVLRINDRGPYYSGRMLDVSMEAAKRLGFYSSGLAPVRIEVVDKNRATTQRAAAQNSSSAILD